MIGPKMVDPMLTRGIIGRHQKSARKTGKMKNFLKSAKNAVNQQEKSKIQLQKMKTIQRYKFGAWFQLI